MIIITLSFFPGPDCFNNVLAKVETRLKEFYAKYDMSRGKRRFAILVGGGSFNPLTRMHLRTYFLAKQCLEAKYGYVVLGEWPLIFIFPFKSWLLFVLCTNSCLWEHCALSHT